jgi:hypothetical protein
MKQIYYCHDFWKEPKLVYDFFLFPEFKNNQNRYIPESLSNFQNYANQQKLIFFHHNL